MEYVHFNIENLEKGLETIREMRDNNDEYGKISDKAFSSAWYLVKVIGLRDVDGKLFLDTARYFTDEYLENCAKEKHKSVTESLSELLSELTDRYIQASSDEDKKLYDNHFRELEWEEL